MGKYCKKHCVIDFKNKIVNTYDDGAEFTYDQFDCTYLIDATINHVPDEGIWITGSEIHCCYADEKRLSDIDGEVKKSHIKKSGTTKLEKLFGCEEYEYVSGRYSVKYNNQVTEIILPKNTFTVKHTIILKT